MLPAIRLNEFLPYPDQIDWNGDGELDSGDEWIEIVSLETAAIDLGGWALDDIAGGGSKPYTFPAGTLLLPGTFSFRFGSTTGVELNNDGDTVRLLAPDGAEVDSYSYRPAHAERSFSRSADGVGSWTEAYPASPGQPNRPATPTPTPTLTLTSPPTATPTATSTGTPTRASTATPTGTPTPTATPFAQGIVLNEFLPEPNAIDWNGDGQARFDDEWIELYNLGATPANLGGWAVADATQAYTVPLGTMIWPRGYLLLYRSQTHRTLGDARGAVSLLRPDGSGADSFAYTQGPGGDLSYCRSSDGIGAWLRGCLPTPGQANRGLPPPPGEKPPPEDDEDPDSWSGRATSAAAALNIAAARSAREGTMATVTGRVTMLPGPLGRRIYLEDETGGIQVYLRRGGFPPLALGDQVRVAGWVAEFHGERQIEVSSASRIAVAGRGASLSPRRLRTGEIGETHEGRLAWVFGRVIRASQSGVTLDDGSGPAYIYFPEDLPWQHPYVKLGEMWGAQGVVGQYASQAPYVGGHRLIPRLATDFSRAPLFLPVTGAEKN